MIEIKYEIRNKIYLIFLLLLHGCDSSNLSKKEDNIQEILNMPCHLVLSLEEMPNAQAKKALSILILEGRDDIKKEGLDINPSMNQSVFNIIGTGKSCRDYVSRFLYESSPEFRGLSIYIP